MKTQHFEVMLKKLAKLLLFEWLLFSVLCYIVEQFFIPDLGTDYTSTEHKTLK